MRLDPLSKEERSQRMALIRSKDTQPELFVRKLIHSMGYRFRLHGVDLPGKPDIVFKGRRKVIFVHGCFWHRHTCKKGQRQPKSGNGYWLPKFEANKLRDQRHRWQLSQLGWSCLIVWECQVKSGRSLERRLKRFLGA